MQEFVFVWTGPEVILRITQTCEHMMQYIEWPAGVSASARASSHYHYDESLDLKKKDLPYKLKLNSNHWI